MIKTKYNWKKVLLMVGFVVITSAFLGGCVNRVAVGTEGVKQETASMKASLVQSTMFSKNLNLDWTYEVYLPADYYDSEDTTYPVFYLMNGVYGCANNWRKSAGLFDEVDKIMEETGKEFIVVAFDGMNSFYIDKNIQMESAIMEDMIPFIEENYRVADTKEGTFIGGLSMGGYGAARLALKYPEKFAGAILLSPSVWADPGPEDGELIYEKMGIFKKADGSFDKEAWDAFQPEGLIDSYKEKDSPVRFYVAMGTDDTMVKIHNVDQFVEKLKQAADVEYIVRDGMKHDWTIWKEQIVEGIKHFLSATGNQNAAATESITYDIDQDNKDTYKRGSLIVMCDANDFLSHFAQGDLVRLEFDTGEVVQMPVCGSYEDVSPGELLIKANEDGDKFTIATNYGQFAVEQGFMEPAPEDSEFAYQMIESAFPHAVTVSLMSAGAYIDRIKIGRLELDKTREPYPDLTDEEYANFREITCGSIAPGILYRSSSPIDNEIGRAKEADAAIEAHGVKDIVNMADSEIDAKKMPGYDDTYYSKCNVFFGKISMSFRTEEFNDGIADSLKFIADNDGPYMLHCVYGKDRTGFLCAIIESLCDASMEEIQDDYLKTYEVLYDVQDGKQMPLDDHMKALIKDAIIGNMSYAYGTEVTAENHQEKTIEFLLSIGLMEEDLDKIIEKLTATAEMEEAA